MHTDFLVVVPFHNAGAFLPDCAASLISQSHRGWRAIFADDASTDGGLGKVPSDPRFTLVRSDRRQTALENIHNTIVSANPGPEDVICLLDGDDFLIRRDALDIVASLYADPSTLLTYGQYVWPNGAPGHCRAYTRDTFATLRTGGYWASHLRTFKYKLYRELVQSDPDLSCYRDSKGEFFKTCYDIAIMTPLMEMAGLDGISFNPTPVYFYRQHPGNDHAIDHPRQRRDEREIFSKPPFARALGIQ